MFEHVVEPKQTTHHHLRRRDPSAAAVSQAERLVDRATVDPAYPADTLDAGWLLLDGHALGDELATARPTSSWWHPRKSVHCARVNTPPWQQASAIHSARGPLQPKGFNPSARPLRPGTACNPTARSNRCFAFSMPETVRNRLHHSQPVGSVLMLHEVPEPLEWFPGRWTPMPAACRKAFSWDRRVRPPDVKTPRPPGPASRAVRDGRRGEAMAAPRSAVYSTLLTGSCWTANPSPMPCQLQRSKHSSG